MRLPPYRPQLAQLVKTPPDGSEWIHELKYDGYRIGCRIDGLTITLISRNGKDWTHAFPAIVRAAAQLDVRSALLDGEVCMVLPDGRTSFQALQNSGTDSSGTLVYFVFDLLYLNGRPLVQETLEARKSALSRIVRGSRIQFAEHIAASGPDAFREACRLGAEGIVSKLRDQPYMSGKRAGWLKTKCVQRQEFVIGGFTDPEGSRQGIGALLVGYYDGDRLVFAGKVGTGFTAKLAGELRRALDRIEVKQSAFSPPPAGWLGRHAHWVEPRLVGEVVFTEWTGEGRIRHPSFQGLRSDKSPRTIVREQPAAPKLPSPARQTKAASPRRGRRTAKSGSSSTPEVLGIAITHAERLMYPQPSLTKLDVARYYASVAAAMMPHVDGRPLTLVRCGNGIAGECIFMKHSKLWAPPQLKRVRIQEKTKVGAYLVIESPEAIVALAQMDILEIHTWNTRYDKVELPDRIVIDLDPGASITWKTVVNAARLVRHMLHSLDLESWVKTTGGRGLHVVVPLARKRQWDACLEFARSLAEALVRHDPSLFTMQFGKRGRERQILVDYLRNNRTNTSIAAFSTRSRNGAPVSVPLAWTELKESLDAASFTVTTVPQRVASQRIDPWAGYFRTPQKLTANMTKALQRVST
ncbi:MAG TPA: DNA ligase D [Vicinamibacterales bacterium]|jgi:bifunctional non-homologous end joining protein LigD|nr:DNA ligase D [Vicinamibacterales bacterium]